MDVMIATTVAQLKDPEADILHNRVCSALAYEMAAKLSKPERKLAVVTDILHNISKEDKAAVLTDPGDAGKGDRDGFEAEEGGLLQELTRVLGRPGRSEEPEGRGQPRLDPPHHRRPHGR